VEPQGIIYRAFVFDRYGALFGGGWGMVLVSAAVFAYVHVISATRSRSVYRFFPGFCSRSGTGRRIPCS
jgi:hypothetical protein